MKQKILIIFTLVITLIFTTLEMTGQTYHGLSSSSFTQNWTNTGLITTNDDWSGVPSIIGYRGDDLTTATGVDPQTVLLQGGLAIDVNANQTNPDTYTTGGVTEFEITNPVVAFQGSGTADAPNIVIYLNTTGVTNVQVSYNLRDIDGSIDNAIQPVALQYRIGTTGDFINIPEGFVADATIGPSLATLVTPVSVTLPAGAANQAQLELRIITTNAIGNDEWVGIDDIVITGNSGGNNPPSITNIIQTPATGITPTTTVSVSANVTDSDGTVASVVLNWGTVSGSLTNPINMTLGSGSTYTTVSSIPAQVDGTTVYYTITATDNGAASTTSGLQSYLVSAPATQLAFVNFPATGTQGNAVASFTVEARRGDNTVDPGYTGDITLSIATGTGTLGGTATRAAVAGVATFNDITFSAPGSFTLNANSTGLTQATSSSITISPAPAITSIILPQFINAAAPADNRIPFAFRATLSNLLPNATYRYINQFVISTDTPTAGGAGNPIFVLADGTFIRSTSPSLSTAGAYGEFTTDATGSFTGWFLNEATTNARFTAGNQVFVRITLNNGAGGTTAVNRPTSVDFATAISFGTNPAATEGTAIRATSAAAPKNFVFLYDNTNGTGRPLTGTSIEVTGVDFTAISSYSAFYRENVSGVNGAWGSIVPNINNNGVRLIEERSLTTGSVVKTDVSADGMWGATNTVNPVGGVTEVLVIDLIAANAPVISVAPASLSGFTYVIGNGPSAAQTYNISAANLEGTGNVTVTAPADYEISLNGTTYAAALDLPFAGGIITGQPLTISVRLKAGLAVGDYNGQQIVHAGGTAPNAIVTCSGNVTYPVPVLAAETVPMYIQGLNGTNAQRVPFTFRATISNMMPNATYRYYNKVVIDTDSPTTDGAGNPIFASANGTFARTSSTSMGTEGEYSEFTTDATGSYSGWFVTEPTGNARFTPGNQVFMRIMLNNGENGTTVVTRLTTAASAGVINFGTVNQAGEGTGIRGISEAASGNMIYLYDNTTGAGRPVYGTSIETTGIDFTTVGTYVSFYTAQVQGNNGSWGGILPNLLPDGIRRIEERSNANGSLVAVHTSEDGVWGIYDTRNPFGGEVDVLVIDLMPSGEPTLSVSPSALNGFTYVEGNGPSEVQTYLLSGTDLEGSGNISVTAPADYEVSSDGTTFTDALSLPFADGIITGQPLTVSVRLKAGLASGDYNAQTIVNSGGGATDKVVTCNGSVVAPGQPELTDVNLPLFIQGINGTNNTRVPFAYRATLTNLAAETTYRFYNKIVIESDAPDYNGAGNSIFVAEDGTFSRTTSTSLDIPGEYGELTTTAEGTFTGWFITEPSGNARFTPGNQIYMRISLNDGNEGTTETYRLTSVDFATVLQFGTEADATHGTAIMGVSEDTPKDFVYLYDNTTGTGRPLYGTHIETSEVDFANITSYAPFYITDVAAEDGSWGGIVPNMNDAGVQRVEVRSLADGSIVNSYSVASGVWIVTDTRNPNGGLDNVLVLDLISIGVNNPESIGAKIYAAGNELRIETVKSSEYSFTLVNLQGQQVITRKLSGSNSYNIPLNVPTGIYLVRLSGAEGVTTAKVFIR
ncbi:MAG: peptidase domain-containing [Bacteroidetes bacterium]|nr:MAG: peptidase domain-containing [Bacteroidota bacterium]